MPEHQDPPSGLERHLHSLRLAHVLPELSWDNTALMRLGANAPDNKVSYMGYRHEPAGWVQHFSYVPFDKSPLYELWINNQNPLRWPQNQRLPGWPEQGRFQQIPLTLMSGPLAFLVFPEPDSPPVIGERCWHGLHHQLRECMNRDLELVFGVEQLRRIPSEKELIARFARFLTDWYAACSCKIWDMHAANEMDQLDGALGSFVNATQHLNIGLTLSPDAFELRLTLPPLLLRQNERLTELYQEPWFGQLRDAQTLNVRRAFVWLHAEWRHLGGRLAPVIERVETQLQQLETLLQEIRSDFNTLRSDRDIQGPTTTESDFCFYSKSKTNWVVRFHGEECLPQGNTSPKGMEAIRLLLASPGLQFQPIDFEDRLRGFGYAKKDEDTAHGQPSPIHDQDNLRQLKELFDQMVEMEPDMEDLSGEEQYKYWQSRFRLLGALYTHEPGAQRWAMEYAKAQSMLEELSIFQDDIFSIRAEALFADQKKSPFEKNRKDAIEKAIRRALDSFYQYPDLQAYLRTTIVTTHREGHAPFKYIPELWKGPLGPKNGWQTET